ncbi:MAG: MFS transporter, partial [Hyphomonadaceae bacterium]
MADQQKEPAGLGRAWWAVFLFVLLYSLSFVDRHILALLADPIGKSLHISDTSLGLLYGSGFGVVYALIGLPLAHFVDRSHRIWMVTGGVLLWSLSTLGSGLVHGFMPLMILRAGVAIGEAVLSPAAISLIADMFPRDKRTAPTAIYTGVATLMSSGAFTIGGAAYALATNLQAQFDLEPWRLALIVVGAPGILLGALLILTVREPPRMQAAPVAGKDFATIRQALAYVKQELALFGFLFIGIASYTIPVLGTIGWAPTYLTRTFGTGTADAGYLFGTVGLVSGVLGSVFWATFTRHLIDKWPAAIVVNLAVGASTGVLFTAVLALSSTQPLALGAAAVTVFMGSTTALLPPLVIQYVAPGRVRARLMAINLMASSMIGLGLGSPLIAAVAENFYNDQLGP